LSAWDDAFRELRVEFVRESRDKVAQAGRLVEGLRTTPGDREKLLELKRRFHGFAGAGSTYGFPRISELGSEGERACNEVLRDEAPFPGALVDQFHGLLDELGRELDGPPSESPDGPDATGSAGPRPWDVLLVDEDEDDRRTFAALAEHEGIATRAVGSRAEAVRAMAERMPDGIITKSELVDGSGYELVEHARSLPAGDAAAILIVSRVARFLDKVEAIHCGADGYFEEPIEWEALMRRLHHLLDRNRAETARVLVVEDDRPQAAFARTVLESAGYATRVCDDPQHFESDLRSFRPDIVIMDIVLPGASGYDLVRYLRQDERHATLPVLFLTTEGELQARIEGARAGGDEHLVKPVAPGLLLSTVTSRVERARFLRSLLERDGLTRLLTHTAFLERARVAIAARQRRPERSKAWVMIDLDHFKDVNDRYGHPVGDRVLAALAGLLRKKLRQSDTMGRYGGEEFAVLLEDLKEQEAVRLVGRVLDEFGRSTHVVPGHGSFRVTFSAGVAMLEDGLDLDAWRQAADQALYVAKAAGRNRVVAASRLRGPAA
jgi:diguanylate cyclase (GGDEF)-like protein